MGGGCIVYPPFPSRIYCIIEVHLVRHLTQFSPPKFSNDSWVLDLLWPYSFTEPRSGRRLRPFGESERVPVYEYPETRFPRLQLIMAHTHGMAYSGREASRAVTRAPASAASASATSREI